MRFRQQCLLAHIYDDFMKSYSFNSKGTVLIIAMIIGAGMLVVAVEVSMFVASTIRQARSIDHTLVAQYAAESGVESALHQIRKEERTTLRDDTRSSSELYTVDKRDAQWTFVKDCQSCPEKFSPTVKKITKTTFGEQQSIDIHLWNEEDGFSAIPAGMSTLNISWKKEKCAEEEDVPWIETTGVVFSVSDRAFQWNDSRGMTKDFRSPTGDNREVAVPLSSLVPDVPEGISGNGLTLRIKPFFCTLRDVEFSFPDKDRAENLISIPNYYLIHPSGTFGTVRKDLQVVMPKYSGTTGVFDYLLFSENKIDKSEK